MKQLTIKFWKTLQKLQIISSHLNASISEKQQIFETQDVKKRLNLIIKIMENETSIIGVEKELEVK